MRLHALRVVSVEGLPTGFAVTFGPGLNLVYGGNGSGKSTIARLVHEDLFAGGARVRGEADLDWSLDADETTLATHRLRGAGRLPHPFAARRPAAEHAACYLLRAADLLSGSGRDDEEIARRLQRELAGGLDLPALLAELARSEPRTEQRALDAALRALHEAEGRQKELAAEEAKLVDIRRRIEEGRSAATRLVLLQARELMLAHERERAPLQAELDEIPPAAALLPADAAEERRDRLRAVEEKEAALRAREEELAAIELEMKRGERLSRPFADDELDRLRGLSESLATIEKERDEAARQSVEAAGRLAGREDLLALYEGSPDDRAFSHLARLAEDAAAARHGLDALEQERRRLAASFGREDEDADELRRGLEALHRWHALDAEDPVARRNRLVLGFLLTALGFGLAAALGEPRLFGLGGFGLGLLAFEHLARQRRRRAMARAEQDYRDAETGTALDFDATAVARARRTLVQRIVAAEETRRRDEAIAALDDELEMERPRTLEAETALRETLARHGIDDAGPLSLVRVEHFNLVVRLRRDQADRCAAEARLGAAEEALDRLQAEARALAAEAGAGLPDSLEALGAGLRRLQEEHRDLIARRQRGRLAAGQVETARRELARARERRDEFHARLGLEATDEAGFAELLRQARRRGELRDALGRLEPVIALQEEKLAGAPAILALDEASLPPELEKARAAVGAFEDLMRRETEIATRIAAALDGHAIDEALERRDRARAALERSREEALQAAIRRGLLEHLARDEEQRVESRVLETSRRLFARFTREAWSLEVAEGALAARDNARGRVRALDELSDGTRVQLLMAARIAFLESIEDDEKVPLLLDEVLQTADPERFRAVADVLFQEARRGRQVLYFTADPHDVLALQDLAAPGDGIRVIALDEVPISGAEDWRARRRELNALERIPAPDGLDAAAYAERLGLAPPDGRAPAAELHLFHLLGDRLDLLHRLLEQGITRLGIWRAARQSGAASLLVPERAERRRLDLLGRAAEKLLERRARGRGRPMRAADLAEFEKSTHHGRMLEILDRERGDAAALLRAIENKEIPNFRSSLADRLRELAENGGFLADDGRLPRERVILEAMGSVREEVESGLVDLDELRRSLERLWDDFESAEAG